MASLRDVCSAFAEHVEQQAANEDEDDRQLEYIAGEPLRPVPVNAAVAPPREEPPCADAISEDSYLF
jgi:hypothetical protein